MQRQASARSRAIDSVQQLPLTAPPVAPDGWNVIICVAGTTFACAEVARAIEGILTNKMTASAAIQVRIVLPLILLLSLIHISEPTRQAEISYAVFCLKKK